MEIQLSKPVFTEEMKNAALEAMQNEFFVLGESVYKFEEEFAKYIGTKYAISVNSGTSALSLSLIVLGTKLGDKIMTTPMSFIATANAIIHASGKPIFSDIEKDTGNIDADLIKDIPENVKGIIPVHLYGNPCNMDQIMELKEKGLFIVEDACQAHGAEYKNKKVGGIGDIGCFSFYSTKNMTVGGDGGMIVTDNEEVADKINILHDCGRISRYEHTVIGYTARLNTINAAIGRVQLKYLDKWNDKRRHIARIYQKNLPEDILLEENGKCVYHIFAIRSKERDNIIQHLKRDNVNTGVHYPIPIHLQPAYKNFGYKKGDYPIAEEFSKEVISLPIFPEMTDGHTNYICEKILEVV